MAEIDDFLDRLLEQQNAAKVSYVDEKYVKTFKIKETSSSGQGVFAERALSVKEPICSLAYPKIVAIDSDFLQTTCYHCLVITAAQLPLPSWGHISLELKTCNGCRLARFCNRDCQVNAWHAYHKYECRILKKLQETPPPAIFRAVLRMVLLKDRSLLSDEEWNRATALTSHEHILTARGRSNLTEMAIGIKHLAESGMSVETIQKLIFIMKFNASELPTLIYGGIGVMLDPLMAKFNHSCEPNLAMRRPEHTMTSGWMNSSDLSEDDKTTFAQVVPLRDIVEGEELFNCYVVPTVAVKPRKAKLAEDYLFECTCHKCQSDVEAANKLAAEQKETMIQFEQWTKNVIRNLAQVSKKPEAFRKAASDMDKIERYLEFPALYTSGDFPQMAMELVLEGLKGQNLDEALIDALRIYFFVNPNRFVGGHNPTNVYTIFLVLDIFDALLMESPPPKYTTEKVDKCLQSLQARGLTKEGLIYWRDRVTADLRKRLEGSGSKDLVALLAKRDAQLQLSSSKIVDKQKKSDVTKENAEQQMSDALKVKDPVWSAILQKTGC